MAPFDLTTPQPCKYPSAHALKTQPSPLLFALRTLRRSLPCELPHLFACRAQSSHTAQLAEKTPHREHTHGRQPTNLATRKASSNGSSRENPETGLSRFSSPRPGDRQPARIPKKERQPMATGNPPKGHGRTGSKIKVAKKKSKKSKTKPAGFELRVGLNKCSKTGDVMHAISLYDSALREGATLEQYHYNVLLYLCSSAANGIIYPAKSGNSSGGGGVGGSDSDHDENGAENCANPPIRVTDDVREHARMKGFEIYDRMCLENIPMSEAALTSVARMALSMDNGDMAFDLVKQMKQLGIFPRLRSYDPALYSFCNNGDVDKAFEVEQHMIESGVSPEEPELAALLKCSVRARRGERVYYLLHKLRTIARQVSPSTAELIEEWFMSTTASRVGKRKWDGEAIEHAMENGGGGWHGLGWLGKGKWAVTRTRVDADGVCMRCGEKLATIDLDPVETENFAKSVEAIASKRERNSSFQKFQRWLEYYGPFGAVIDAANVGLFSQRRFSLIKVNAVFNGIRQVIPSKKWPLIILHNRRLTGGKMDEPMNAKLIDKWKKVDAIYATPTGSNDDWYWLYAAIKCKSLIVTNDEMRDHIFQNLGNDFFPKWKERHQVHFSLRDGSFEFHMPPPCSIVIQESKEGHWHIPILAGHEPEEERTWLCVIRANSNTTQEPTIPPEEVHPEQTIKSAARSVQAHNKTRPISGDGRQQQRYLCEITKSPQINKVSPKSPKPNSIASDIEASEKLSGCIIDFQI